MKFNFENSIGIEIIKQKKNAKKVYLFKCEKKARKSGLCKKCANNIKLKYARENFISSKLNPYEALYHNFIKHVEQKKN